MLSFERTPKTEIPPKPANDNSDGEGYEANYLEAIAAAVADAEIQRNPEDLIPPPIPENQTVPDRKPPLPEPIEIIKMADNELRVFSTPQSVDTPNKYHELKEEPLKSPNEAGSETETADSATEAAPETEQVKARTNESAASTSERTSEKKEQTTANGEKAQPEETAARAFGKRGLERFKKASEGAQEYLSVLIDDAYHRYIGKPQEERMAKQEVLRHERIVQQFEVKSASIRHVLSIAEAKLETLNAQKAALEASSPDERKPEVVKALQVLDGKIAECKGHRTEIIAKLDKSEAEAAAYRTVRDQHVEKVVNRLEEKLKPFQEKVAAIVEEKESFDRQLTSMNAAHEHVQINIDNWKQRQREYASALEHLSFFDRQSVRHEMRLLDDKIRQAQGRLEAESLAMRMKERTLTEKLAKAKYAMVPTTSQIDRYNEIRGYGQTHSTNPGESAYSGTQSSAGNFSERPTSKENVEQLKQPQTVLEFVSVWNQAVTEAAAKITDGSREEFIKKNSVEPNKLVSGDWFLHTHSGITATGFQNVLNRFTKRDPNRSPKDTDTVLATFANKIKPTS